jgi:glycosyltransferase involved in cell wall biosynthesis
MSKLITIIIPTKNEEEYLPKLLNSFLNQKNINWSELSSNIEILICDNNSTDKTKQIAQEFAKANLPISIIEGGLPAVARNNGAKKADSTWLWFIDSDVVLSLDALNKYIQIAKSSTTKTIYTSFVVSDIARVQSRLFYFGFNTLLRLKSVIFPLTGNILGGWNLLIKKTSFDEIGGFDEILVTHEDIKLGRQFKVAELGIINTTIKISSRRFVRDGFWNVFLMYNKVFWQSKLTGKYNYRTNQLYFKDDFGKKEKK